MWKWIDRTGMILLFFSFWFAAPELLGEETLRRYIKNGLYAASFLLSWLVWLTVLLVICGALSLLYPAADSLPRPPASPAALLGGDKPPPVDLRLIIGGAVLLVASGAAATTRDLMTRIVINPLLSVLADNSRLRGVLLTAGMWMFVSGSSLQFVASFFD